MPGSSRTRTEPVVVAVLGAARGAGDGLGSRCVVCVISSSWSYVCRRRPSKTATSGDVGAVRRRDLVRPTSNVREPSLFDDLRRCRTRWVTLTLVRRRPRPRLVVMMTTPLAALEPYSAAAEAPFRTSMFSMSFGLRSAMRLTGLSWVDALPPAAAAVTSVGAARRRPGSRR